MKRFYKVLGLATVSFPFFYKPVWKAFTTDESAEGVDLEHARNYITQELADMAIFSCTKERELANDIALRFNSRLGKIQVSHEGPGHETKIQVLESIRAKRVFLICSFDTSRWSFNESLIDLFLTIGAMKRSSPVEVNVVLPYYAYCRQNSPTGEHRRSIFAADIAFLLEAAGADKVFTVNLHSPPIIGSFTIPVLNVDVSGLCATYFKKYKLKDPVLVCANDRLMPQAVRIQNAFKKSGRDVEIGCLAKKSGKKPGEFDYIGRDVKGRDVLILDNIIDTGDTTLEASKCLNELGAKDIYMFGVHGILSDGAVEKINESYVKELVFTNTMPLHMAKYSPKINQISVAAMLAETIAQSTFNKTLTQIANEGGVKTLHSNLDI